MAQPTPGPYMTQDNKIFGPLDPKSHHQNGRVLLARMVETRSEELLAQWPHTAALLAASWDLLQVCVQAEHAIAHHLSPPEGRSLAASLRELEQVLVRLREALAKAEPPEGGK